MVRTSIVTFIVLASFILPSNLNLCLSIAGGFLGFIVTILIPVTFYNKAKEVRVGAEKDEKDRFVSILNYFMVGLASTVVIAGLVQSV